MKSHPFQKGFTLIELLVVVSIIGLLSSIVLSSLVGARDKARIAADLEFAATNYHAFGAGAIGYYTFNDGLAAGWNSIADTSVNGYNLTPTSGSFTRSTITPSGSGYSLVLNGTVSGLHSIANGPTISSVTASAFVYLTQPPGTVNLFGVDGPGTAGSYNMIMAPEIDTGDLYCYSAVNNYQSGGGSFSFSLNKWYYITCSINGTTGVVTAYVDGKQLGASISNTVSPVQLATIAVGNDPQDNVGSIIGYVDDYSVYTQSLSAAQIQEQYAEALNRHEFADAIRF